MKKFILGLAVLLSMAGTAEAVTPTPEPAAKPLVVITSKCLTDKPELKLNMQVYALINLFYKTPTKKDPTFGMKDDVRIACNNALYDAFQKGLVGKQDIIQKMSIKQTGDFNPKQTHFIYKYTGKLFILDLKRNGSYANKARVEKISGKTVVKAF